MPTCPNGTPRPRAAPRNRLEIRCLLRRDRADRGSRRAASGNYSKAACRTSVKSYRFRRPCKPVLALAPSNRAGWTLETDGAAPMLPSLAASSRAYPRATFSAIEIEHRGPPSTRACGARPLSRLGHQSNCYPRPRDQFSACPVRQEGRSRNAVGASKRKAIHGMVARGYSRRILGGGCAAGDYLDSPCPHQWVRQGVSEKLSTTPGRNGEAGKTPLANSRELAGRGGGGAMAGPSLGPESR